MLLLAEDGATEAGDTERRAGEEEIGDKLRAKSTSIPKVENDGELLRGRADVGREGAVPGRDGAVPGREGAVPGRRVAAVGRDVPLLDREEADTGREVGRDGEDVPGRERGP